MSHQFKLSTKAWVAIALVAALYLVVILQSEQLLDALFYGTVTFCTAGIAAFDSMHIRLRHYKTWIAYGPVGVFVVCALFWPIAVVWYFVVRVRISRGTMPLRAEYRPRQVA